MNDAIKFFTTDWAVSKDKEDKEDNHTFHFIASKEIVDRDYEIVNLKGLNINNFKKNPVILLNHRSDGLPIGKATNIWKKGNELHVKIQFAAFEEYELADTVRRLVEGGYLKSLSIRFLPNYDKIEYIEPTVQNRSKTRRIFHTSELLEISVATIPANAAALLQAKSKMLEEKVINEVEFEKFIELYENVEDKEIKDEFNKFINSCDNEEDNEKNETAKKSVDEQLIEIKEEIAVLTKLLEDTLHSEDQDQEETNYFEDLFKCQDDEAESSSQSDDISEAEKGMFHFLDTHITNY